MTFLAPLFLSLAVLAGVPLLVHLLRRRVTRTVAFPAVRFLQQSQREHDRERLVRNRLLLLLRLLAVLALVAAVARPVARIAGTGHPPVAVAIVLDHSMSTGAIVDGRTLFARLQEAADAILSELTSGDQAWLVTSSGVVLAGDAPTLRAAIAALEPEAGRGDLDGALRRALRLVQAGAPRTPVVALLTDGQRSAFDATPAPLALDDVPLVVHVPALTPPPNRAVLDVAVSPTRWMPGGGLQARLAVTGPSAWRALLGDRTIARGTADVASASDSVVDIAVDATAADTGWLAGRVELDPDDFPGDDLRHFVVRVASPTPVDASPAAGPFVRAALDALVDDGRLRRVTGVPEGVVHIVSAGERVSGAAVRLAPANPLQVVAANRALEQAGIPWRFGALLRDTVLVRDAGDEARDPVAARDDAPGLAGTTVTQRYQLTRVGNEATVARDAATVLLEAGGTPWLVVGRNYALLASPITPEATDAPLRGGFLPWLRDLVSRRLGDDGLIVQAAPGDTIAAPLTLDSLVSPSGTARPVSGVGLVVPETPGVYTMRQQGRTVGALVVNVNPDESQVAGWGESQWQDDWISGARQFAATPASLTRAVFDRAGGRSIVWPLVALALVALALEALVSRGWLAPRADSHASATASVDASPRGATTSR